MKKSEPEIKFPCVWEFRLITDSTMADETEAGIAALEVREKPAFTISRGEASSGKKYLALRLSCQVESLERAKYLAGELGKLPGVKFMI